ncbi:MAG: DegT/DnrJ/EryC1/StrS family aminotransferase [Chloroflexi bacterium]|nr:DegT/DnrJ/EryC1/StrS family aminotransferase [Chloroflexota bacterium]
MHSQQIEAPAKWSIQVARPMLGEEEIEAVARVLRSGHLVQGALVEQFERRFAAMLGARHAVALSNGTAALHLALLAHGISAGDEVITSPFTFIASANAALYVGARPVFVDIRPDTFNLDPGQIEASITPRTRAIVPVHLYGQPAELDAIHEIAARHQLAVIEDAAQAHGAAIDGRIVGSTGTACFSFYATKNVTTAEGGLVTTDDDEIVDRLRLLRSHGQRERYHHEILGYNFRLTDVQAAIGLVQLDRLEALTDARIRNAACLSARLSGVRPPVVLPGYRHVFHQYTVRIPHDRDGVARRLAEQGIGTGVHYPVPVHQQPLYRDMGYEDHLPESERASREVLSLPVHPGLTTDELDAVATTLSAVAAPRTVALS